MGINTRTGAGSTERANRSTTGCAATPNAAAAGIHPTPSAATATRPARAGIDRQPEAPPLRQDAPPARGSTGCPGHAWDERMSRPAMSSATGHSPRARGSTCSPAAESTRSCVSRAAPTPPTALADHRKEPLTGHDKETDGMTPEDFDHRTWLGALVQDAAGNAGRAYREYDGRRMVMWIGNAEHTPAEPASLRPYDPTTDG